MQSLQFAPLNYPVDLSQSRSPECHLYRYFLLSRCSSDESLHVQPSGHADIQTCQIAMRSRNKCDPNEIEFSTRFVHWRCGPKYRRDCTCIRSMAGQQKYFQNRCMEGTGVPTSIESKPHCVAFQSPLVFRLTRSTRGTRSLDIFYSVVSYRVHKKLC